MEVLIDHIGRVLRIGKRNVAFAVSKLGHIHIHSIDRTVTVTLKPGLVYPITVAAAAYKIGDLDPERTVVIAATEDQECWIFPGYMHALCKMASFANDARRAMVDPSAEAVKHLLK